MIVKRLFDLLFSITALPFLLPVILASWLVAGLETGRNGLVLTRRVGQHGRVFTSIRIRTRIPSDDGSSRWSASGRLFDALGIDVWPEILNVIVGNMSIVGPEAAPADGPGSLSGEDRVILNLKPGMTGPTSLKIRRLRRSLTGRPAGGGERRDAPFPELVRLEKSYYYHRSLLGDVKYLFRSIIPFAG